MLRLSLRLFAPSNRRYKHMNTSFQENAANPLARPWSLDPKVMYMVSVPIGNVKDFTLRSLEVLRRVDYVVCSNRTATKVLFSIVDIDVAGRLIQWNKAVKNNAKLIEMLKGGATMAFVVNQGSPAVADDGAVLVREMQQAGIRVSAVPGVDACTTALTMSGAADYSAGAYHFAGYVNVKHALRLGQIRKAVMASHPTVFFEAPARLVATLQDIEFLDASRRVTVLHEMTKAHEATHADEVHKLVQFYQRPAMAKTVRVGQLVIIVDGLDPVAEAELRAKRARASTSPEDEGELPTRQQLLASIATPKEIHPPSNSSQKDPFHTDNKKAQALKRRVDPGAGSAARVFTANMPQWLRDALGDMVHRQVVEGAPPKTAIRAVSDALERPVSEVRTAYDAFKLVQAHAAEKHAANFERVAARAATTAQRQTADSMENEIDDPDEAKESHEASGSERETRTAVHVAIDPKKLERDMKHQAVEALAAKLAPKTPSHGQTTGGKSRIASAPNAAPSASSSASGSSSHFPDDWLPADDTPSPSVDITDWEEDGDASDAEADRIMDEAADAISGKQSAVSSEPSSIDSASADSTTTPTTTTSSAASSQQRTAAGPKKKKLRKGPSKKAVALRRKVAAQQEKVRLLTLGMMSSMK